MKGTNDNDQPFAKGWKMCLSCVYPFPLQQFEDYLIQMMAKHEKRGKKTKEIGAS
jgi:hypothetical protein